MARIKCFFISIIYLLLVISFCGCNPTDGLQERLSITLAENEELMIHPFLTENGDAYAVALPAHWSINKLIARYTSSDGLQIGETQIQSNWTPLHVELQMPYELADGMQITFYQVTQKIYSSTPNLQITPLWYFFTSYEAP